ncbi:hypothetical protein PF005_g10960 [Phytophthora fragariae]|uniref:Myb/SANT-like domain-containing protein n=1 Tax=Phytophthora fragariae TaxID=53985 RepID=A0A6A3FBW9_9STRA|nr:hypothetical protein PF003_g24372 [Phytophthora fragariae]KAE8941390.1 hypothetical protein PF009_g8822 [Phytophthora fragariae]KAE9120164.1 hypothetical protein PF007_g8280 [Phytophthora fragariae]KAE9211531.1 hypothetical protein PF005_g10960 [Phytophthora fragariae]
MHGHGCQTGKAGKVAPKKVKSSGKNTGATSGQQRASWAVYEEFDLLDLYAQARENPSLTIDKGLKAKAWCDLTGALNAKHKRALEKAQYKSKLGRIMRDYDLYKEIKGLSGVGVCPTSGKLTFPDDVWDALIEAKPKKQRSKVVQLRDDGFEHEEICSMIAGDLRATGAEADTRETLLGRMGPAEAAGESSIPHCPSKEAKATEIESDDEDENMGAPPDIMEMTSASAGPPSNKQRLASVRRIHDGAARARRSQTSTLQQEMASSVPLLEEEINESFGYDDESQLQADV